ncbi:unnamed protein product [Nesidiocoris tenuis]|uniref:Potassium channel domain-containing protein n=1 Tax=Nesidiocoris tenuis TaxID=355587 RepID=A0A6H5GSG2_9HEMI|nr:unnamed protein product [Nesidiocoris tenuis]
MLSESVSMGDNEIMCDAIDEPSVTGFLIFGEKNEPSNSNGSNFHPAIRPHGDSPSNGDSVIRLGDTVIRTCEERDAPVLSPPWRGRRAECQSTMSSVRAHTRRVVGLRRSTFLLSVYAVGYVAYLLTGGIVFAALEAPVEADIKGELQQARAAFLSAHPCVSGESAICSTLPRPRIFENFKTKWCPNYGIFGF